MENYLDFLSGLFKSDTLRPAIFLAYLTGVLQIVRDRHQTRLNNFSEFSILSAGKLAEFIGFTSDEVKELCKEYNADYEEYKRWYDGYSQRGIEIYNPESVVKSLLNESVGNYWSKTSAYAVIADRIQKIFEGTKDDVIKMISGESVDVVVTTFMNTITDFRTKDDVITYLIHLGYLAYNNEDALQSAIYLSYIYALNKYTVLREVTCGKGFADVVFIPFVPNLPAMIIELKRNGTTESAINQIKEKRYFSSLEHYSGNLLFVGINYDEDKKTHKCKIEQFVKGS